MGGSDKFAEGRPAGSPCDDKNADKWCTWAASHNYLGQGIPMSLLEQDGVMIFGGNPFENTIIVDDRSGVKTISTRQARDCVNCDGMCKQVAGCRRTVMTNAPRHHLFMATDRDGSCGAYGARMGSLSRDSHPGRNPACVATWTDTWQKGLAGRWSSLDLGVRNTLTIRLAVGMGVTMCPVCKRSYKYTKMVLDHLRMPIGDGCFDELAQQMEGRLAEWSDDVE